MKIDPTSKPVVSLVVGDRHRHTEKSGQTGVQTGPAKVTPGPTSFRLHAVDARAQSDGVFDPSRVHEIKQAISEGRFKVNADVVADRLLETVRELLQGRNRQ
jgi:negative regulator of flagellin synthesis FlgM